MLKELGKRHWHIDNGGISVSVKYDTINGGVEIEVDTSYFGYPAITVTLRTNGHPGPKFLEELGTLLIKAASLAPEDE